MPTSSDSGLTCRQAAVDEFPTSHRNCLLCLHLGALGPLLCSSRNPASDSFIFIHLFIFLLSLFLKARLPPYSALSDFKISSPTDSLEHLQNVLPMSSDTLSYCALAVISSSNIGFPVSLLNSTTLPRASCCRRHRLLLSQAFELRH